MRILFILLLSLMFGFVSAQNEIECSFSKNEIDAFTKEHVIWTKIQTLYYKDLTNLSCGFCFDGTQLFFFMSNSARKTTLCLSKDVSKIYFKFANDSVFIINYNGNFICNDFAYFSLNDNDVKLLTNNDVKSIRVVFTDGYIDYELPLIINNVIAGQRKINPQQYFKKALRCIENEIHSK